jgi:hypothetical protein
VVDEQSFDTLTPERFWGPARFCFFPFALSLSKGWGEGARLRQAQPERVVDEQSFDTLTPERCWGSARFCFFPFALSPSKGWG